MAEGGGQEHQSSNGPSPRLFRWSLSNSLSNTANINNEVVNQMLRELINRQDSDILGRNNSAERNRPSHHHHHHHSRHASAPTPAAPDATAGSAAEHAASTVINIGDDGSGATPDVAASADSINNNTTHDSGMSELQMCARLVEKYLPFAVLLLLKIFYDHRLGTMVLIGLFGTLYHANTNLKKQVARKERRSIGVLSWIICLMIGNVCLLYFVFQEEQLYYALIFMKVQVENWDIWALMWVIGVSDFALKFAAIAMKAVIAMLPNSLIPFKRRGKYYMIFEETSHFYRAFLPINPWMCFLGNRANDSAMSFVFSTVLAIAYCVFKGVRLLQKTREMTAALQKFLQKSSYGTTPTKEDFSQTGSSCPICQDEVHDPIMLACKHIFCEECVSMWFDRERTCPMCRANIIDDPKWRDGGTVGTMQLF